MEDFIKYYGTLILAIYGIVQIWLIALIKKYLYKGTINLYETGNVEIGYSTIGPSISLKGTLRALNQDLFISSIYLVVIREKDQAQHIFNWLAFQSPKIEINSQPLMEIPSGFLLSPNSPHKYNILFFDNVIYEEIRQLLFNYNRVWFEVEEKIKTIISDQDSDILKQGKLIDEFRKNSTSANTYNDLTRKFYWEPGFYKLIVNVKTSKPDNVFTNTYKFEIKELDFERLKLNVITMLEEPISRFLKLSNHPYYTTYSDYLTNY